MKRLLCNPCRGFVSQAAYDFEKCYMPSPMENIVMMMPVFQMTDEQGHKLLDEIAHDLLELERARRLILYED